MTCHVKNAEVPTVLINYKFLSKFVVEFNPSSTANSFPVVKNRRYAGLSAEILCQMGELVTALSEDNACKKVELTKLQQYVSKLQVRFLNFSTLF